MGVAGGRLGAGRGGIAAVRFETVTWMVELPFAFPTKPDTSIVNESDRENPDLQCMRKTNLPVSNCRNAGKR